MLAFQQGEHMMPSSRPANAQIVSGPIDFALLRRPEAKAARELLGWSRLRLAARAGIGGSTIRNFELGRRLAGRTIVAIQRALEAAGVEYTNGAPGVKPKAKSRTIAAENLNASKRQAAEGRQLITGEQVKTARKLLGWSQMTLGFEAGTNQQTVLKFERGESRAEGRTISAFQRALESGGVEFTNGGEPGVKLKAKPAVTRAT
jgi:transcriptional regulator with XRE-family HTH domain